MNGNRHFLRFFNSNSHSHSCNFFFGIAIPIPILILELGFHESTTELGQLLISDFGGHRPMSPNILVQIGPFELKICQEPYFCMRNPKKMVS